MIADVQAITVARAGEVVVLAFDDLEDAPDEVDPAALEELAEREDVVLLDADDAAYIGDELKQAAEDANDVDLEEAIAGTGGLEQ